MLFVCCQSVSQPVSQSVSQSVSQPVSQSASQLCEYFLNIKLLPFVPSWWLIIYTPSFHHSHKHTPYTLIYTPSFHHSHKYTPHTLSYTPPHSITPTNTHPIHSHIHPLIPSLPQIHTPYTFRHIHPHKRHPHTSHTTTTLIIYRYKTPPSPSLRTCKN